SVVMVPTSGNPRCGLAPSTDLPAPNPPGSLPRWISCRGFAGLLILQRADGHQLRVTARAAALPGRANPDYAVLVDLPVDEKSTAESLQAAGIQLGHLSVVGGDSAAAAAATGLKEEEEGAAGQPRSLLNTATFLSYTDWQHGTPGRAAMAMNVRIGLLYG